MVLVSHKKKFSFTADEKLVLKYQEKLKEKGMKLSTRLEVLIRKDLEK